MTDLRTAAQAVIDIWNDPSLAIEPAIEALRQALAEPVEPVALAMRFHEAYERLAPKFGYVTRQETRAFDPVSQNGQLMIAVCAELYTTPPSEPVEPVAKIVRNEAGQIRIVDGNGDSFDVSKHIGTKLYTTPPSLDALIAEIDVLETFSVSGGHGEPSSQAISVWKLKPILDKYRGQK